MPDNEEDIENYNKKVKNSTYKSKIKFNKTKESAGHNDEEEEEEEEEIEQKKKKTKKKRKINYEEEFKEDFSYQIKKETEYNTLNESVCTTLKRDLIRIWNKLVVVILPISNQEKDRELRHWDLWGPFLFCILLGL